MPSPPMPRPARTAAARATGICGTHVSTGLVVRTSASTVDSTARVRRSRYAATAMSVKPMGQPASVISSWWPVVEAIQQKAVSATARKQMPTMR